MFKQQVILPTFFLTAALCPLAARAADTSIACIIPYYPDIMFWSDIEDSMHQAADDLGVDLMMLYTKHTESNIELTLDEALSLAIYSDADAIITSYTLADDQTDSLLALASEEKIPVVMIDCDCPEELRSAYIGIDNESAGCEIGTQALEALDRSEQALLVYPTSSQDRENLQLRVRGIRQAFSQNTGQLKEFPVATSSISDVLAIRQALVGHPEIASIIAINENSTLLCAQALSSDQDKHAIRLYGFDESDQTLALLDEGSIDVLACQLHSEMGYQSVKAARSLIGGNDPGAAGVHLIDFVIREHS